LKKLIPILQNLIYTTYLAELLPFLTSLFFYKRINNRQVKVFFFYIFAIAFFICLSVYFKFHNDRTHQLLVNRIFLVIEFTLLSTYYYYQVVFKYKKIFLASATLCFLFYSVFDYLTAESSKNFSFIPLVMECMFFVMVIIYFFYEKIQFNLSIPILHTSEFWVSIALLLYFSGNFFLFLYSKSMYNNPSFRVQFTIIYNTLTIIKDILLTVAVLVNVYIKNSQNHLNNPIDIDLGTFNPLQNKPNF